MPMKHSNEKSEGAVGYTSLEFRRDNNLQFGSCQHIDSIKSHESDDPFHTNCDSFLPLLGKFIIFDFKSNAIFKGNAILR